MNATLPAIETPQSLPPANDVSRSHPFHIALALGGTDLGRSGIGTYVREVLPPLIEQLTRNGGTLTAFGLAAELEAYRPALAGAQLHAIPASANAGLNAAWHLSRAGGYARKLGADALLLPAANRRTVARAPIPTVAVVHDLAQLRVPGKYDALRMFYFRHVLLRALRVPTRLVAVSRATRDDLVNATRVPADRIRVVYNGVNTRTFRNLDPASDRVCEARQALGLERRPYLLYPARLEHPGKNHARLLRAFARSGLRASHTLALSGGDWGAGAHIREVVQTLRLQDDVKLLGFVSNDRVPPLVAGADAVLMLGLHEGFGLPALEALSAGTPVCVSSTGALPEVVGSLGVQCDPFDPDAIATALQHIVSDAPLRARCRAEGPAWADQFSWTRTAQGLLDACTDAIASTTIPE